MTLRANLLADVRTRLVAITSLNLASKSAACDLYEVYVFSLVVEAAQRTGARVWYENLLGEPDTNLVFRTSPGRIFAPNSPPPAALYSHAVIEFDGTPELELHQGIYVSGKSGLLHECGIAIVWRSEAQTCRAESVSPRSSKVVLAGECKFYSSGLGIGTARGFIGLTLDISVDGRFFVSNTSSESVKTLLTHHKRDWGNDVSPSNDVRVNQLRALFEQVFEEFKARRV